MMLVKRAGARLLAAALIVLMLAAALPTAALAATVEGSGNVIRLTATEGTVTVKNGSGQKKTVLSNMQLYSGWTVETASGGVAWLSIDATTDNAKVIKLGGSGKVELRKNGLKNDILLHAGQVFFSSEKEMKDDETLNIRTTNMVCGVRGSSGVVNRRQVIYGTGHALIRYSTRRNAPLQPVSIQGGQLLSLPANGSAGTLRRARVSDFPVLYLEEVAASERLQQVIDREGNYSAEELIAAIPAAQARESAYGIGGPGTVPVEGTVPQGRQVNTWGKDGLLERLGADQSADTGTGSGGGATPTYAVNIAAGIQNGTVRASASSAAANTTVTLTVTPAEGYQLATLTVTDADGAPVTVTDNRFTMPAKAVTVSASFENKLYSISLTPALAALVDETSQNSLETAELRSGEGPAIPFGTAALKMGDEVTVRIAGIPTDKYVLTGFSAAYSEGGAFADYNTPWRQTYTHENEDYVSTEISFNMPAGDLVLDGGFVKSYPVNRSANSDTGSITIETVGGCNQSFGPAYAARGETVTLTAAPTEAAAAEGYRVKNVRYGATGGDSWTNLTPQDGVYSFTMPNTPVTVEATFDYPGYSITPSLTHVGGNQGGKLEIEVNEEEATEAHSGETVMLTFTAPKVNANYYGAGSVRVIGAASEQAVDVALLERWYNDDEETYYATYCFEMPAENVTVTGRFSQLHTLTLAYEAGSNDLGELNCDAAMIGDDYYACQDETVGLFVTPAEYYGLNALNFVPETGGSGRNVTRGEDGDYSFEMPSEALTVTAGFGALREIHTDGIDGGANANLKFAFRQEVPGLGNGSTKTFEDVEASGGAFKVAEGLEVLVKIDCAKDAAASTFHGVKDLNVFYYNGGNPNGSVYPADGSTVGLRYFTYSGGAATGVSAETSFTMPTTDVSIVGSCVQMHTVNVDESAYGPVNLFYVRSGNGWDSILGEMSESTPIPHPAAFPAAAEEQIRIACGENGLSSGQNIIIGFEGQNNAIQTFASSSDYTNGAYSFVMPSAADFEEQSAAALRISFYATV